MTDSSWHNDEAEDGQLPGLTGPQPQPPADPAGEPGITVTPGMGPPWPGAGPVSDTVVLGAASPPGRTRRIRTVVALAAAVAVLAVAGITLAVTSGGTGKTSVTQRTLSQLVAAAVRNSASFRTLSGTFSEQISGPGFPGISASGADTEIRNPLRGSLQMTESVGGQVLPMSAIVTTKSIYFKFGAVHGLPQSMIGKWIEMSFSQMPGGNVLGSILRSVSAENPAVQMQPLLAAQQVRIVGSQVVAGVETTKYQGSLTLAAMVKKLPASVRAQLAPELRGLTGVAHFTVWIDGQGRLRKMIMHETIGPGTATISMTVLSYNQPVTITIPPPSQVLHLPASALGGTA